MSEQFAMQPDEFESTNNRLDSILDRLNALGESAASMKDAPLRPLQSVPPLDPGVAHVVETPVSTPPPDLGLVQPVNAPVVDAQPVAQPTAVQPPVVEAPAAPAVEAPSAAGPIPELPTLPEVPSLAEAVTPSESVFAEPVAPTSDMVDPAPVAVEHYGLDLTPASVEPASDSAQAESMGSADVFELDTASLEAEAAIDPPDAPTSIFSLASNEPETSAEEGDGWVSHHGNSPIGGEVASVDEDVDPMWAIDPVEPTDLEDAPVGVDEGPVDTAFFATSTVDAAMPVEDPVEDLFAALEELDEPVNIAGIDMAPAVEETPAVDGDGFTSDEDLPIPDFTGVYNESPTEGGFWADSEESVPKSVEPSIGQLSARREELDKLRPVEGEEAVVLEKESGDRSVMLQIVGVIFVGILAVLAVFLLDPAAVADMRESLEGLLP